MKKIHLMIALVVSSSLFFNVQSRADSSIKSGSEGEKIFIEQADQCLTIMEQAAQEMSVTGVAVIAFIPGNKAESWTSKMKVVGALTNESANFLAIAYSKASEMADTYKTSGIKDREPLHGEFGYQGGVITKVKSGYILAVFSGATGEQDEEIASKGLDLLSTYY